MFPKLCFAFATVAFTLAMPHLMFVPVIAACITGAIDAGRNRA